MNDRTRRVRRWQPAAQPSYHSFPPPHKPPLIKTICNYFGRLLIFIGLVVVFCVILEYHCSSCDTEYSMNLLNKNIEDIALNLASIEKNYRELESQISHVSKELPKIEGQLEILEFLATSMDPGQCRFKVWEPRSQLCLPNVDISLAHNNTNKSSNNVTSEHVPVAVLVS